MGPPTAAAIIAGGRARRFGGRDKSRLIVHGLPIINRQMDVLQHLASNVFIVSPDAGRFVDWPVPVHADLIEGAGALGGIYTALEVAVEEPVLVVACDLPFLHAGLLGRLVELSVSHDAAWVCGARGPEPLLACYRRAARATIRREIDAGRLKASALAAVLDIAEMQTAEIERFGSPDHLLTNVNTPEDYERVRG